MTKNEKLSQAFDDLRAARAYHGDPDVRDELKYMWAVTTGLFLAVMMLLLLGMYL